MDDILQILREGHVAVLKECIQNRLPPIRELRVKPWLYRLMRVRCSLQDDLFGVDISDPTNRRLRFRGIPVVPGPRLEFVV